MRAKRKLLALGLAAALQPAVAAVVTVDFEDPSNWGELLRNQISGLSFGGDAWALGSERCGGDFSFTQPGSCGALALAVDPWDPSSIDLTVSKSLTINFAGGFVQEFSFALSLLESRAAAVQVFDGLDGTGNLLGGTGILGTTPCGNTSWRFCEWSSGNSIKFDGTAKSVKVTGLDQNLLLDNLRFITADAPGQLPEPGSIGLTLSAIGALAWVRRRATR